MANINKEVIPIIFPDHGESPEKAFQRMLKKILSDFGLSEIRANFITNEFYSFDALGFPQYSLFRTNKNIVYLKEKVALHVDDRLFEDIKILHRGRFGYDLERLVSEQAMLISHTTSTVMEFLMNSGPDEIFVISKTFRGKAERMEKTQVDICLRNRTLPEVISFVENLYEIILNKKIKIRTISDFYFFCEPSFSFSAKLGESNKEIMLGSGGFMREEELTLLNKKFGENNKNIIFIGFPYQKILNLSLGEDSNNWNANYNKILKSCQ